MSKIDDASNNGNQQFNQASNPQPPEKQGIGSEQVKNSSPQPPPPAPAFGKNEQARIAHSSGMQKDEARFAKNLEAAKSRQEQQNQLSLDNKDKEK